MPNSLLSKWMRNVTQLWQNVASRTTMCCRKQLRYWSYTWMTLKLVITVIHFGGYILDTRNSSYSFDQFIQSLENTRKVQYREGNSFLKKIWCKKTFSSGITTDSNGWFDWTNTRLFRVFTHLQCSHFEYSVSWSVAKYQTRSTHVLHIRPTNGPISL